MNFQKRTGHLLPLALTLLILGSGTAGAAWLTKPGVLSLPEVLGNESDTGMIGTAIAYDELLAPGGMMVDPSIRDPYSSPPPAYLNEEEPDEDFSKARNVKPERHSAKGNEEPEELNHEQQPKENAANETEPAEPASQSDEIDAQTQADAQQQERDMEAEQQALDSSPESSYDSGDDTAFGDGVGSQPPTEIMIAPRSDRR